MVRSPADPRNWTRVLHLLAKQLHKLTANKSSTDQWESHEYHNELREFAMALWTLQLWCVSFNSANFTAEPSIIGKLNRSP